tara:strand:- start:600 stop:803 length:204 start_codon:yes stop_codon:yes gene_type:complete
MATMLTNNQTRNLRQASGEELLMLAIFGGDQVRDSINRELDRRAHAEAVTPHAVMAYLSSPRTLYAA